MKYIRTLNQVRYSEFNAYGMRACDLAKLQASRIKIPSTFVITTEAWDELLNRIKYKIDFILKHVTNSPQSLQNAYNSIRKLIIEQQFPNDLIKELREAYESLNVNLKTSLNEMVKDDNSPFVSLYVSPNYDVAAESFEGIIQNIHGFDQLIHALKEAYAMMYTAEGINYRKEQNISDKFKTGIIIQDMKLAHASATAYSSDPQEQDKIFIFTYKGFTDLRDAIPKDHFLVAKEFLNITENHVVEQSKIVIREEDNHLNIIEFHDREQSLNDKEVMELARLTKKAELALENPTKCFFTISDEFYLLFSNRYAVPNFKPADNVPVTEYAQKVEPNNLDTPIVATKIETIEEVSEEEPETIEETQEPIEKVEERVEEPTDEELDELYEAAEEGEKDDEDSELEDIDSEINDSEDDEENDDDEDNNEDADETDDEEIEYEDDDEETDTDETDDKEDDTEDEDDEYEYIDENGNPITEEDVAKLNDNEYEEIEDDTEYEEDYTEDNDEELEDDEEADADETDDEEIEYEDEDGNPVDKDGNPIEYEEEIENDDEEIDDEESDNYEDDEEYEYIDENGNPITEKDVTELDDDEYEEIEDDTEYEEDYTNSDADETDDEDDDSEEEVEDDNDEEYEESNDEKKEIDNESEENNDSQILTNTEKENMNKSFRLIYGELSKLYEKNGEQAPDTITEIVQLGTQKGFFKISGLQEILEIKRKIRRNEPIKQEEQNLVLEILNKLLE